MKVVRTISEMRALRSGAVGLVPTMGAFHEGHLSLMRSARELCDQLVVSLFVNPLQFGPAEDWDAYPRNEERDISLAQQEGVDVLFAPSVSEMYESMRTTVRVSEVSDLWEGERRPGHFEGVATVVAKLFGIVGCRFAHFGQKDYQQCRVIESMTNDLSMDVVLFFHDTIRESDGLAMSSRNVYLSPEERTVAPAIFQGLQDLAAELQFAPGRPVEKSLQRVASWWKSLGLEPEYLALVDADTLKPLKTNSRNSRLITAVRLGSTRLIDNVDCSLIER